ncbi:MAG: sulfatase-like hydrolase/transferase [Actinomycetota bacterium]|nr:sulfatase-like hydrolase/transferase [Actinomycetota bacterium]
MSNKESSHIFPGRSVTFPQRLASRRLLEIAHLSTLSAFAIAQPLLDLLGRTPVFFTVRGWTRWDIVAFTLAIIVIPAGLLMAAELVARVLVGRSARRVLHLSFVAALGGLVAAQALKKANLSLGWLTVALALALGLCAAIAYARSSVTRSFLTILTPAPLVVAGIFLLNAPVSKLVLAGEPELVLGRDASRAPVVMLVFDEFSTASIMNREHEIDEVRFPNLAALARESTWFRNATSVASATERAVPAILTGTEWREGELPTFQDHPRNLFSLLGASHDLEVQEPVTNLCPRDLCGEDRSSAVAGGMPTLASDVGIVYLHLVAPEDLAARLPSIDARWGGFGDAPGAEDADNPFVDPATAFGEFLQAMERRQRPTLYFLHIGVPHIPWQFLPSAKRYPVTSLAVGGSDLIPGLNGGQWGSDPSLVTVAQQRYLLQLGFVDHLVGRLRERLRETGLEERALLVVTADHGVSFYPGEGRRVNDQHPEDIAFVPLFIKSPGQRDGRVVDDYVRVTDIVPTIAEILDVSLEWPTDGQPALAGVERDQITLDGRTYQAASLSEARDVALSAQAERFGANEPWRRLFSLGPHSNLIGMALDRLPVREGEEASATIDEAPFLENLDPAGEVVPTYINGTIEGSGAAPGQDVAVSVNGEIAAVTTTHAARGDVRFSVVVPEETFRAGANDVRIFRIEAGGGELVSLSPEREPSTFRLVTGSTEHILSPTGRISIVDGKVTGHLDHIAHEPNVVYFAGWAADIEAEKIRDRILVFSDGRFLYSSDRPMVGARPDLVPALGDAGFPALADAAFAFAIPTRLLFRETKTPRVRIFAVVGDVASELAYPADYPWGG